METLCLIVCKELLMFNELPINSVNVATLYNFAAESDKLEELSLIMARKSTAQVAAKIKHLNKTKQQFVKSCLRVPASRYFGS